MVEYYELNCGIRADPEKEYDCEVCRGLVDAYHNIIIKSDHYPSFEEAESLIQKDLEKLGYDGVYGITPVPAL